MRRGGWLYGVFHEDEPDRCRYGGITTTSIRQRSYGHWGNAENTRKKPQYGPMPSWLRKHRVEKDKIHFIEIGYYDTVEELKAAEIEFIARMRSIGQCDLNLTDGGEGGNGWRHTPESKRKLSEAFSGSKNPQYGKDRREMMLYALSFKGPVTDDMKDNLSEKMRQHWEENPEKRVNYSERVKGYWAEGRMTPPSREQAIRAVQSRKSTLPDDKVREIRNLRTEGKSLVNIADITGVSWSQVRSALGQRRAYDWVDSGANQLDWRVLRLARLGLEVDDVHRIRKMFDSGATISEIREQRYPELDTPQVRHITSRRGYKWVPENKQGEL